jgi:hypothetical protein
VFRGIAAVFCACIAALCPGTARGYGNPDLYVTLGASYSSISGPGIDGQGYFQPNPADLFVMPDVSAGFGLRVGAGARYERYTIGVVYCQSVHDGAWFDLPKDSTRRAVLVDGAIWMSPWGKARPRLRGALGPEWLAVEDAYYRQDELGALVGDVVYFGLGVEVGVGLEYSLTPRLSLAGDIGAHVFSLVDVSSDSGHRPDMRLEPTLLDVGVEASFGVAARWRF